jgi:hypothetical protein
MRRHRPGFQSTGAQVPSWSRRRLSALILGSGGLAVVLLWGLALTLISVLHPSSTSERTGRAVISGRDRPGGSAGRSAQEILAERDELAARAMPSTKTPVSDVYRPWEPAPLSTRAPGAPIVLPPQRGLDRLGVSTGYPRTPEGAIAQLAAIDQIAMQSGSLPGVRAVITGWAAAGGPSASTWSGVKAMTGLLDSAGLSAAGSPNLSIVFTPAMGLVKGTVGDDFAVVCVDFAVDITLDLTRSAAIADCQRMLWQDGRWVIGPGSEPAEAISVWPGTDAAFEVGFRDLVVTR